MSRGAEANAVIENPHVKKLWITGNTVSRRILRDLVWHNTTLVELDVDTDYKSPRSSNMLLDALVQNKSFKNVSLGTIVLDVHGSLAVPRWIAMNDNMEKLHLTTNRGDERSRIDPYILSDAIAANQVLTKLSLINFVLSSDSRRPSSIVKKRNSTLRKLKLSGCTISSTNAPAVCYLVGVCSGLRSVELSGKVSIDDTTVWDMGRALRSNPCLST